MPIDVTTSEYLARLQGQTAGAYERVKRTEQKSGGRELPPNLKDCIGQATRLKLEESDKNGSLYAYLYATTCEPPNERGVPCGVYYPLSDDLFKSQEQNFGDFLVDMKALKPKYKELIESQSDSAGFWRNVFPIIFEEIEKEQMCFTFHTGRKRKDGAPNVHIDGPAKAGYIPPKREGANQHTGAGYQPTTATAPTAPVKAPPGQAAGKAPPGKGPPKKGPPKKEACPVKIGDVVKTVNDPWGNGEVYQGTVEAIKEAEKIVVLNIDGTSGYDVPWTHVEVVAIGIQVGQAVKTSPTYFNDDNSYTGTVVEISGNGASVKFENGDTIPNIPLDQLSAA